MAFWYWIAITGIALLALLAMLSRIRIRVRYSRSGRLDQLIIVVQALYGLFHYRMVLPSIVIRGLSLVYREKKSGGLTGKGKSNKKRVIGLRTIRRYWAAYRTLLSSTAQFKLWARQSLKKVECTRWRLDFTVGTGDAAQTAVLTGLLWAVAGCASGIAGQTVKLATKPQSRIEPNYAGIEFTVVWEADFQIRVYTVCNSILKLGRRTIRFGKALHAWRRWMTPPKQA